jgi:hypothetical protein
MLWILILPVVETVDEYESDDEEDDEEEVRISCTMNEIMKMFCNTVKHENLALYYRIIITKKP